MKFFREVKVGLYEMETWTTVARANVIFSVCSEMRWNPQIQYLVRNKQSYWAGTDHKFFGRRIKMFHELLMIPLLLNIYSLISVHGGWFCCYVISR
jgi:hypothetical protein